MERVRFSNYFGTAPVTIGAARLAIATTPPAVDPANDVALSFSGSPSITIAPGTEVMSDPVSLTYTFGKKMAVTAYVQGTFAPLNQHDSQVITNYSSAINAGNTTTDTAGTSINQPNTEWFLLSGMDVYGQYQGTVAIFGSSTIDGHNSNFGDTNAYPVINVAIPSQDDDRISDALARTLNASGFHIGVLNAGILGEFAGPTSGSPSGSPGVDRIGRDVLHQPGIKTVVIDLGQVDLRQNNCGEATEVEASLQNMVSQANAAGVNVILGTIAPASYCTNPSSPNYGPNPTNGAGPFGGDINPGPRNPENVQRDLVNSWIKTTGVTLPGVIGVADFEAVLADPEHPDFIIPNLNSGDNFHPDGPGYQVKSQAIAINSLLAQ
jgi:lysophospholipase L1-like esterase